MDPLRRHRQKRLKIDVACETCRAKKVRCDGARPACGYCSRKLSLRDNCRYSNDSTTKGNPSVPPQLLPSPVNENHRSPMNVAGRHSSISNESRANPRPINKDHVPSAASPLARDSHPIREQPSTSWMSVNKQPNELRNHARVRARPGQSENASSPSIIDSMTTVVDEGTHTHEFFGSSSTGSFTAQIKKAIDIRLGIAPNCASEGGNTMASKDAGGLTAFSSTMGTPNVASYVLPPRRQADHLIELYWFYVDPLYPFLDKEKWHHYYNAIFAGTVMDTDEQLFVATLYILLAISTQLLESLTANQRDESSTKYMKMAQEIMPLNLWSTGSLELVQYLLLTSQYLQSTNQPNQTWITVGSSVRIAQGLGLHLPETSAGRSDAAERELMRRLWYGCILMDRMVSITHGRPAMVSEHVATVVPFPISNPPQGTGPEKLLGNAIDHALFFVKSVQLYEITHRAIISLYGNKCQKNGGKTPPPHAGHILEEEEDIDTVVRLDRSLTKWESDLPERLRWSQFQVSEDKIAQRQIVILQMRFLHARILLLRPILSRFCLTHTPPETRESISDSLQARVVEQGALLCVSTAQRIVALLVEHQTTDGTVGLLPAWWYRVYYVYSAATILITARLRPEVFPIADVAHSWAQAMSLLKADDKFGNSARRCHAALQILSTKMLQLVPGGQAVQTNAGKRTGIEQVADGLDPEATDHAPAVSESTAVHQQHFIDEFTPPIADLGELGLEEFDIDVNDMSWLNEMHAAWGFLNE